MDKVETRGRVPLETLLRRLAWRNAVASATACAAACAACAGLLAGLMAAAGLRGCAPAACGACGAAEARAAAACLSAAHAGMQAGLDAARTRAALERNIREGIYPDVPCGEEEREDRSRFSNTERHTRRESEVTDGKE